MKAVRSVLFSPFFTGGLAVVLIAIAILWVGDALELGGWAPFASAFNQWLVIGLLVFVWLLLFGIWIWRRQRRNAKLVEEIAEPVIDPRDAQLSDEEAELNRKFADALKKLAKLKFRSRFGGSRYLYQLPWYVFIGPPKSGKTTALEKCRLDFPLGRRDEKISIDGGSGTRNCDWVFTSEAVFIDTAGRYVEQADQVVDGGAWSRFLKLLVRHRPAEPINGVIVAISVEQLAKSSLEEVEAEAARVHARLAEIVEQMKARVPVYVMFTKADYLTGFDEFFQTMKESERRQVWGVTFPSRRGAAAERAEATLTQVGPEYDRLLDRLGEIQFRHVQEEPDIGQRALIFGFSSQFASLKPVVDRFLAETFRPDKVSETLLLRGFYFTSATQEGQPVDRLMSTMRREFGLQRRLVGARSRQKGRAYFLQGLLNDVIFPEAGIVSGARRGQIAGSIGRYAALAACVALPIACGLGWWWVQSHTEAEATKLRDAVNSYTLEVAKLQPQPLEVVKTYNIEDVNAPLKILRAEWERIEAEEADQPLWWGLGIDEMDTLRNQAKTAYVTALNELLRPRLLFRMQDLLYQFEDDPKRLFRILKAYLMLGGEATLEHGYVLDFVQSDWDAKDQYPRRSYPEWREEMGAHLATLLDGNLRRLRLEGDDALADGVLDTAAIQRARRVISKWPYEDQALEEVLASQAARRPDFNWLLGVDVEEMEEVFVRRSGRELSEGVKWIYTYDGFWEVFEPQIGDAVETALADQEVREQDDQARKPKKADILERAYRLYYREYQDTWNSVLNDLRFREIADADDAKELLTLLSADPSPLEDLLELMVNNVALDQRNDAVAEAGRDVAGEQAERIGNRVAPNATSIITRLSSGVASESLPPPGAEVSEAFTELIRFYGDGGRDSKLGELTRRFDDLLLVVDEIADRGGSGALSLKDDRVARTISRSVRNNAPRPVAVMVQEMIDKAGDVGVQDWAREVAEEWRETIYPVCRDLLHNKYPFAGSGGREVGLGDLWEVLGPNGLIDRFYQERVKPEVRERDQGWEWRRDIGIPASRLQVFEAAADLSKAFFPPGGAPGRPQVQFGLIPQAFGEGVGEVHFSLGGRPATFRTITEGANLEWPGGVGGNGVVVELVADELAFGSLDDPSNTISRPGAWGLFRLFDQSNYTSAGAQGTLRMKDIMFIFNFTSTNNPFTDEMRTKIRGFRCRPDLW